MGLTMALAKVFSTLTTTLELADTTQTQMLCKTWPGLETLSKQTLTVNSLIEVTKEAQGKTTVGSSQTRT
jgi:hypothetical protein